MNKKTRNIQLNFADGEKKLTLGNLSVKKIIYIFQRRIVLEKEDVF